MIYREEIQDLFSVPNDYYLAHCISADFGMGKGIVVEFNKRFDMKKKLQNNIMFKSICMYKQIERIIQELTLAYT